MSLNLVHRAGLDTLGKLEAAASLRFREARVLHKRGEQLGAIHLYGYSVEIRLKVAYYHTIGLVSSTVIDRRLHRRPAEVAIGLMPSLPHHASSAGPSAGHHIMGWAALLVRERAKPGRNPMDAPMAGTLQSHATNIFQCWSEILRYRANKPYNVELQVVSDAAMWFRAHAGQLWR